MATNSLDFLLNLRANTESFNNGIEGAKRAIGLLTAALAAVGIGMTANEFIALSDATQQMNEGVVYQIEV